MLKGTFKGPVRVLGFGYTVMWGVSENEGYLILGPYNKDPII